VSQEDPAAADLHIVGMGADRQDHLPLVNLAGAGRGDQLPDLRHERWRVDRLGEKVVGARAQGADRGV
jgi:hypothetical protein